MKPHMVEALNKLADLKNYTIEMEHLSDPPEEAFKWGTDPFYAAHRNVSLELMHKGHEEDAWKLFDDFVNYQHPTKLEEARADLKAVKESLVPLTPENIERLWKEHKSTIVMTDIFFKQPYVNYVFVNVSDDERFMMLENEYALAVPINFVLNNLEFVENAYLDVYNTRLNNARYPFLKM